MLNTAYNRIATRRAAIKAEADVSTGKPSKGKGAGARGGEQIAGNLYRSQSGEFQAGPAGQLRARIEAIRELRKGKGKGKAKAKGKAPKPTPEQLAAQAEAERQANVAAVGAALDNADNPAMSSRGIAALDALRGGEQGGRLNDELVKGGFAERGADGRVRLSAAGNALLRAADSGDETAALDAISKASDKAARAAERDQKKTEREKARGGRGKKKPALGGDKEAAVSADKEAATQAKKESNRAAVAEKMMANDAGVTEKGLEGMAGLASGDPVDAATVDQLTEMGLAERAKDGTPRLTTQGRAAVRAAEKGDYGATVDAISRAGDAATTRKEKEQEQADLEAENPSDDELTSEAAANVGLDDDAVAALQQASDEGGAAHEALAAAGMIDADGAATAEGVDALNALEKGDVRGYRRAARKARARVRREKAKADKDAVEKVDRDVDQKKKVQADVAAEVARITRRDPARGRGTVATKAQEQAHTGVMVALMVPSPVLAGLPGVTEPSDGLHITLAYLGDATDIQLAPRKERLIACLRDWASGCAPLAGVINGLGRFFNREQDDTNAVYAAPDVPGLSEARQSLIACLSRAGVYAAGNHGFTPHITLAYVAADASTPDIRLEDIPIAFDAITLAWGDERMMFPFAGAVEAHTPEPDHLKTRLGRRREARKPTS